MDFSCADIRALGGTVAQADIRVRNEDFRVDEALRFEPGGEGAHAWLRIEKYGKNTMDVARILARHAGVRAMDVGFAGQKDRHAVSAQWFSVSIGNGPGPDWDKLSEEGIRILAVTRHGKKLRRGQLAGNRFSIRLRNLRGDRGALVLRLRQISRYGVPNYFGPQRFGRDRENLRACARMFAVGERIRNRHRRGMLFSAARAWLFNRVLSRRVEAGTWDKPITGDILMFEDSRSRFLVASGDPGDDSRVRDLELHPTGPLWGEGSPETSAAVADLEREVAGAHVQFSAGLERAGLEADRRALRLAVKDLRFEFLADDDLQLDFFLRPGAFATTVLAELADTRDVSFTAVAL